MRNNINYTSIFSREIEKQKKKRKKVNSLRSRHCSVACLTGDYAMVGHSHLGVYGGSRVFLNLGIE